MLNKVLFSTCLIFVVITIIECCSFGVGRYVLEKGLFYQPKIAEDYVAYLLKRDPILGWPSPDAFGKGDLDVTGSRIVPAFPDPVVSENYISLYGDSFVWSAEVDNRLAWGNVLSKRIGRRVANYGASGYGTDQAFLRFKHNVFDQASIVVLCHLSENILRNVNQFRDLLYPGDRYGFKPRFILDAQGQLGFVPLPRIPVEDYEAFVQGPERFLKYDFFAPDGPSGLSRLTWPYSFSLFRALKHFYVLSRFQGVPWYADFYKKRHPSQGLQVTTGIISSFVDLTKNRNKIPIVVILPTYLDFEFYQKNGKWVYQNLIDELHTLNIATVHVGAEMLTYIGAKDPRDLFGNVHYNKEGYALIATVVYNHLRDQDLLSPVK